MPPIVYYLLLLITISIQVFFIRNCIKKWRNIEDTGLIKSIRSQLPVDICNRELDYIFDILNMDFESTQKNIGKYCVGNKWFMGVSYKNESIAILYNNIKRYEWTTIRKGDKDGGRNDIKGLIVTCIYPQVSYKFGERKTHDVYEYLKKYFLKKILRKQMQ